MEMYAELKYYTVFRPYHNRVTIEARRGEVQLLGFAETHTCTHTQIFAAVASCRSLIIHFETHLNIKNLSLCHRSWLHFTGLCEHMK